MFAHRIPLLSILLLAAATIAGCSPAQNLVGVWKVDTTKLQEAAKGNPLMAIAAGSLAMIDSQIEFKGDGNFIASASVLGQSKTETGSWRFVKVDGDTLVLMVKGKGAPSESELRVRMVDSQHMEMVPPTAAGGSDKALPFVRVKSS